MRKDITSLVDTLRTSVLGIAVSATDKPEELLNKSFTEFGTAVSAWLDDRLGAEEEPLRKGLNHISAFASALNRMNQTVTAIKTGRPSYMLDGDSSQPAETVQVETSDALDRFIRLGVLTLRGMVNDTAELPVDEEDLERAERAGTLIKIEAEDNVELLVKSDLPDDLRGYLSDPLDLLIDATLMGRELIEEAQDRAEILLQTDPERITDTIAEALPEVFDMAKAFPPPKKKPAPAQTASTQGGGPTGGQDEDVGDGGDPDDNTDEPVDDGADGLADGAPSNPLETMVRLASIIVVIGGSLLQGQGAGVDDNDQAGNVTGAGDADNIGLQRQAPSFQAPLAKILNGEIAVDPTLADALEERGALLKQVPALQAELDKLRKTTERLQRQPAPLIGVKRVVAVDKAADIAGDLAKGEMQIAGQLEGLMKTDPDAAARLLIRAAHAGGGRPLLPG